MTLSISCSIHRRAAPRTERGTTLLEVTLSLVLFTTFAGSIFMAVDASAGSYGTEATAARLDADARRAMNVLTGYLREADFASITPVGLPETASSTWLDFQRPQGFQNGAVVWGPTERLALEPDPADPENGADDDGDGMIDEGRVVWIEDAALGAGLRLVVCSNVPAALAGEVLGNNQDDNGNGLIDERGFCVEFAGSRLIARLTVEEADQEGNSIRRSAARSTTPRNTPEEE